MFLTSDFMNLPDIFFGRDGFVRRHGIKTSRHSLVLGWDLTGMSVPILNWHFRNNTSMGEVTKLMAFLALIRHT